MANTTGGPISEMKIAGRQFQADPETDPDIGLGGFKATVKKPAQGDSIVNLETMPGSIKGIDLILDEDRDDLIFLQNLVNQRKLFDVIVVNSTGVAYGGKLIITSDIMGKIKGSTISLDFEGNALNKVA